MKLAAHLHLVPTLKLIASPPLSPGGYHGVVFNLEDRDNFTFAYVLPFRWSIFILTPVSFFLSLP
jgi:hypothetical protein